MDEEREKPTKRDKAKKFWSKVEEPFKKADEGARRRKKLSIPQRILVLARLAIFGATLAGLIVHGVFKPSDDDQKSILDRGVIPAAFGADMLLQFSLMVTIFFHKWIDPAIGVIVDVILTVLLACNICILLEDIPWITKIIILALSGIAIALHTAIIIRNSRRIRQRRAMRALDNEDTTPSEPKPPSKGLKDRSPSKDPKGQKGQSPSQGPKSSKGSKGRGEASRNGAESRRRRPGRR